MFILDKLIFLCLFTILFYPISVITVDIADNISTSCRKNSSTGLNKFIRSPEELDRNWNLPFRNASKIWKDFVPWIDKPINFSQLPPYVREIIELHRHDVTYNVTYKRKHPCWILKDIDLMCEMKKEIIFRTIQYGDGPFVGNTWRKYIPMVQFNEILQRFKSCAVVSSSSSLKNLYLGEEIDKHEAVFRFNFAPVEGFEKDVGRKKTLRIINSMAFKNEFDRFVHITNEKEIVFLWDPSQYHENLSSWYYKPQYNFFMKFMEYKRQHPKQNFFIIDPRSIWRMYDFIQDYSGDILQKTSVSSGFIGSILALNLCDLTHLYSYLPSPTSITKKCYYFKDYVDMTCTYGGYHPELYEKNVIVQIKQGPRDDVAQWGRSSLPGFNDCQCESKN